MKAISWSFILLPTVLLPVALIFIEASIDYIFAWLWILFGIGCVGWGIFIFRRYRGLARACLAVGFLHITLMILLPIFIRAPATENSQAVKMLLAKPSTN
jgi:hypothetical protein